MLFILISLSKYCVLSLEYNFYQSACFCLLSRFSLFSLWLSFLVIFDYFERMGLMQEPFVGTDLFLNRAYEWWIILMNGWMNGWIKYFFLFYFYSILFYLRELAHSQFFCILSFLSGTNWIYEWSRPVVGVP